MRKRYEDSLTPAQIKFIRDRAIPTIGNADLLALYNRRFRTARENIDAIGRIRHRLTPGFKVDRSSLSRRALQNLAAPVGAIRFWRRYKVVKIEGVKGWPWRYLHKVVWEARYGQVPKGYSLVFVDGDKANCDLANILAVPKALMAFMTVKKLPTILLADPEAVRNLALMHQLARKNKAMRYVKLRKSRCELPYKLTGRPGFAL